MAEHLVRIRATARGRVQMVGYRAFVQQHAQELGIRGEVANRPDGSVEVVMEGPRPAVERMTELLRRGPSFARVEQLDVHEEAARGALPPMRVTS